MKWSLSSWKTRKVNQEIFYQDTLHLHKILNTLSSYPPLVSIREITQLKKNIAEASKKNRFIIQAGDCAESFSHCHPQVIAQKVKILFQLATIIANENQKPVTQIGRIAGQYSKPRSKSFEMVNDNKIFSFRGENIHSTEASVATRSPDPKRLERGYFFSSLTLNFIRTLNNSYFNQILQPQSWQLQKPQGIEQRVEEYQNLSKKILTTTSSVIPNGINFLRSKNNFFTSHEGLHLPLEQGFTKKAANNKHYNLSAHTLWLGERTRDISGAHVEYFRGIDNPVGIKIGPSISADELCELIRTLNPLNSCDKIMLIPRLGHSKVINILPKLIESVENKSFNVCWLSDPMHGNTYKTSLGQKTRNLSHITSELRSSIQIHKELGSHLAGVHLELTGENVTECIGGIENLKPEDLQRNYTSLCDPRLNYTQSIEVAYDFSSMLKKTDTRKSFTLKSR